MGIRAVVVDMEAVRVAATTAVATTDAKAACSNAWGLKGMRYGEI